MNASYQKLALCVFCLSMVAGCSSSGEEQLQQWMTEQRNATRSRVDRLPEPTKFTPQAYTEEGTVEPFSNQKLAQALKRDSGQSTVNAALIAPELARRKEPLEASPLDSVAMVGSLIKVGQPVALVRVDNLLYQVRVGNYLGQNYGKITKVSETGISLREIVQDAAGEWIEADSYITAPRGIKMNKHAGFIQAGVARLARHDLLGKVMVSAQVALIALSVLVTQVVQSQTTNSIQSVVGSVQGGSEVIRIDLSEPLTAIPTGFSIQTPARIALDFPGVGNAMGRTAVDMNLGNLRSANVIQAGERTRVVLNLRASTAYKAEIQGKSLFITLDSAVAAVAPSAVAPPAFAENRNRDTLPLKDLDFRRGTDNSGRIIVDLPNNQVGVDIRQQGQTLVVEFLKTALPEGLRRRLDVSDFGTPVQSVTTFQTGDKVRMVIEPKGLWEHSAYQSDNQFVVEVRQQKVDTNKLTQGPGYSGEKLSLNFQNIEIRSLLQVIADFTNFNIIASDTVTGAVTLRLKDVPWDQALDIILQARGLGMRKTGNVLLIAPKDELVAKERQELESRNAVQNLEQLRTQDFRLNYAKVVDVAAALVGTGGGATSNRILSSRGSVLSEARTNQMFVTDIPSRLEQVQALIAKLDIPVRQVLIEARIVEASDSFGKSLGVRLGGQPFSLNNNTTSSFGSTYAAGVAGTSGGNFVNLPGVGQNGFQASSFAVSLFNVAQTRFLNLEISAAEADGKGKIVSSPRIVTADQVKALIEQGTELPYQQATSSGATAVAFRKANLKLEVTPQITPEGNIILSVDVNKDSVGRATANGFAIDTKHIQTQVLVENGGTVVIGGIYEQNDREDETKVPLFGDIPVIGNLFKQKTRTATKSELLVFITPKMLTNGAPLR